MDTAALMQVYVALVDRWRQSLGLSHAELSRLLDNHKSQWSRIRRGLHPATGLFHAKVVSKAEEPWRSALSRAWEQMRDAQQRELESRVRLAMTG